MYNAIQNGIVKHKQLAEKHKVIVDLNWKRLTKFNGNVLDNNNIAAEACTSSQNHHSLEFSTTSEEGNSIMTLHVLAQASNYIIMKFV